MRSYLEFEKPVADLEGQIQELRTLAEKGEAVDVQDEIAKLEAKAAQALNDLYQKLTPWQKTQVARHPDRPHFTDYVAALIEDFTPLAGDRAFGEDAAIVGGFGRFRGQPVCVMGHEKGSDTASRLKHNFGMAKPEGYRKAIRLMELADRFGLPVVSLVDTSGAFPGVQAEERGQAEAIARSTEKCLELGVPMVAAVMQYTDLLRHEGLQLLAVIGVGTVLVMVSTALAVDFACRAERHLKRALVRIPARRAHVHDVR